MDKFRKIVVAGLARNVAKEIVRSYETLSNAFSMFDDVTWLIIESDSTDGTIEELNKLKNNSFSMFSRYPVFLVDCIFSHFSN